MTIGRVTGDQSRTLDLLGDPGTHGGAEVLRIDTHASVVFLAGDRAYKLKRAVVYPYLDYGTPARRRAMCEAEVAINRRTAPRLYLGVAPIVEDGDGLALGAVGETGDGDEGAAIDGMPIDWVVVMRRFPDDAILDAMARHGALDRPLMWRVADAIAGFHAAAEPHRGPIGEDAPGCAAMRSVVEENLAELSWMAGKAALISPALAERIAIATRAALAAACPLLDARASKGFVRRCHGDLHLRNIVLFEGAPRLFDAIEFSAVLATTDILYDLAYLLMDLEHRGLRDLANAALNRYLLRMAGYEALALLPLFLATRAAIRAKVGAAALDLAGGAAPAQAGARAEITAYAEATARYLEPPPPRLVAIGGLSGSGKSSLAFALAPALGPSPGAVVLRSDEIRKSLAGVALEEALPPAFYTREWHRRTFAELHARAGRALAAGHSVVLDAVHADPRGRAEVEALAHAAGVSFQGLWLDAPAPVLKARVTGRGPDASDAGSTVVDAQLGYDLGTLTWPRLDAGAPLEKVARAARAHLSAEV